MRIEPWQLCRSLTSLTSGGRSKYLNSSAIAPIVRLLALTSMRQLGRSKRNAASETLIISLNFERLIARQPLLKRPLLRLGSAMRGGSIAISSYLLADPPADVAAQIRAFVKSHAPADYLEQEDAGERAPDDPEGPSAEAE